jgi:hypothetical protein
MKTSIFYQWLILTAIINPTPLFGASGDCQGPYEEPIDVVVHEANRILQLQQTPPGLLDSFFQFDVSDRGKPGQRGYQIRVDGRRWENSQSPELDEIRKILHENRDTMTDFATLQPHIAALKLAGQHLSQQGRLLLVSIIGQLHQKAEAPRSTLQAFIKALGFKLLPVPEKAPLEFVDPKGGKHYFQYFGTLIGFNPRDEKQARIVVQKAPHLIPAAKTANWINFAPEIKSANSRPPPMSVQYRGIEIPKGLRGETQVRIATFFSENGVGQIVSTRTSTGTNIYLLGSAKDAQSFQKNSALDLSLHDAADELTEDLDTRTSSSSPPQQIHLDTNFEFQPSGHLAFQAPSAGSYDLIAESGAPDMHVVLHVNGNQATSPNWTQQTALTMEVDHQMLSGQLSATEINEASAHGIQSITKLAASSKLNIVNNVAFLVEGALYLPSDQATLPEQYARAAGRLELDIPTPALGPSARLYGAGWVTSPQQNQTTNPAPHAGAKIGIKAPVGTATTVDANAGVSRGGFGDQLDSIANGSNDPNSHSTNSMFVISLDEKF